MLTLIDEPLREVEILGHALLHTTLQSAKPFIFVQSVQALVDQSMSNISILLAYSSATCKTSMVYDIHDLTVHLSKTMPSVMVSLDCFMTVYYHLIQHS